MAWTKRERKACANAIGDFGHLFSGAPTSLIRDEPRWCVAQVLHFWKTNHKSEKDRIWYGRLLDRVIAEGLPPAEENRPADRK